MCKLNKWGNTRIDPCMRKVIHNLNKQGIKTLMCCCGHGKYPTSIIINIGLSKILPLEIFSGIQLEGKKKFYKKDKDGYYYISETIKQSGGGN